MRFFGESGRLRTRLATSSCHWTQRDKQQEGAHGRSSSNFRTRQAALSLAALSQMLRLTDSFLPILLKTCRVVEKASSEG